MARTLRSRSSAGKPEPASNPPGYNPPEGWSVERVASDQGAKLFEFGPAWYGWSYPDKLGEPMQGTLISGGIAKLKPPPGTPLSAVDLVERYLYAAGMIAVRVMPSDPDDLVQVEAAAGEPVHAPPRKRSLRQVAVERAERVANPRDPAALVVLVNEAMDHGEVK